MAVGRKLVGKRPSARSSDFPLLKTLKRAVMASQLRDHSLLIDLGQLTRVISIDAKARTSTVQPASPTKATPLRIILWRCWARAEHGIARPRCSSTVCQFQVRVPQCGGRRWTADAGERVGKVMLRVEAIELRALEIPLAAAPM
jgi:hypothetical protein